MKNSNPVALKVIFCLSLTILVGLLAIGAPRKQDASTFSPGVMVTNAAPSLSYGSVTPSSGGTGTLFTYTVTYTDADNQAPYYIYAYIDGYSYSMSKQYSGDYTYTDGCSYTYSRYLAVGSHTYYFYASDGSSSTTTSPCSGPTVTITSLTSGSVTPASGFPGTQFTYTVTYTNANNQAPLYVYVCINGVYHTISKQYSWDNTYTDGCVYAYSETQNIGSNTFIFQTYDGTNSISTSICAGPSITYISLSPLSVSPDTGDTYTHFQFRARYSHYYNEAPSRIVLCLDGDVYTMTKLDPADVSYSDGVDYAYSTYLDQGIHEYHVECSQAGDTVQTTSNPLRVSTSTSIRPEMAFTIVFIVIGSVATISTASIASKIKVKKVLTTPLASSPASPGGTATRSAITPTSGSGGASSQAGDGSTPVTPNPLPPSASATGQGVTSCDDRTQAPSNPPATAPILPGSPKWARLARYDISMYCAEPDEKEQPDQMEEPGDPAAFIEPGFVSDVMDDLEGDVEPAGEDSGDRAYGSIEPDVADLEFDVVALSGMEDTDGEMRGHIQDGEPKQETAPKFPTVLVVRPSKAENEAPLAPTVRKSVWVVVCPSCHKKIQLNGIEGNISYLCRDCKKPMQHEVTCSACSSHVEITQDELHNAPDVGLRCPVCLETVKL